jgi:hypothetical protein
MSGSRICSAHELRSTEQRYVESDSPNGWLLTPSPDAAPAVFGHPEIK